MTRQVDRLYQANRFTGTWPPQFPRPRPRGIKALGYRYEAALAKALPAAERGIWWEFRDANGPGLCQTDFLLATSDILVVLECKHTWTPDGLSQLAGLYLPVVAMATNLPVAGVQICKHIVPWADPSHSDLHEAIEAALTMGTPTTFHWRGITSLQLCPHQPPATAVNPQGQTSSGNPGASPA